LRFYFHLSDLIAEFIARDRKARCAPLLCPPIARADFLFFRNLENPPHPGPSSQGLNSNSASVFSCIFRVIPAKAGTHEHRA
jgi:hypothetical protein